MAVGFNTGNYVKFVRGTPTLWNSLVTKNSDTLYFIVDPSSGRGALYLGSTLIAGDLAPEESTLAKLADINITGLANKDILIYNDSTEKWENTTLADAISETVTVMEGATATTNGLSGLVPQPLAGQQKLFLRANGTWANPTEELEATVAVIVGDDTGMSMRAVAKAEAASAVAAIVADAPESFDTLKEIADWIDTHPEMSDVTGLMTRVSTLENVINGTEGNDGLVSTVETMQTTISNLNTVINGDGFTAGLVDTVSTLQTQVKTNSDNISELAAALKWQDMIEI